MGKSKPRFKSRPNNGHKSQPSSLQLPTQDSIDEDELHASGSDVFNVQSIIEEIQSSNSEDRLCGLQALVTVAGKSEAVDTIVKKNVIKIVGPFLIDKNSEVRNLTAGILRNLSASGSIEICERLVKDDIMTPLVALLQQYNDWKPSSDSEDSNTLLQVVNILWNLCEIDETAMKYFMTANLLNVLLRCLDYNVVGLDLSIAVCQCLNSVSEDNAAVIAALRSHEAQLVGMLTVSSVFNKLLFLKTLVAGIVVNLNPSTPWLSQVLAVVQEALSADLRSSVSQLSSQLPLDSATLPSADTQEQLDNTVALTEAQTMALEILTNLCSSQDEEMDIESDGSLSEGEEEINGWHDSDSTPLSLISSEISEGLQKYQLVSAVVAKLEPFPDNVVDIVKTCSSSKDLAKKLVRLQCRAFLCFNNLIPAMDVEQFGGPDELRSLISKLCQQRLFKVKLDQLGNEFVKQNGEILEAVTSAIRAALLCMVKAELKVEHFFQPEEMKIFFHLAEFLEPQLLANTIRIVGASGQLVVTGDLVAVKMAGNYLLEVAEKELALWLTAEALDTVMDLFTEDCTDRVASEIGLVRRLEAIAPRLKTKMRKERRTLGDHYPLVSTVMDNLRPFIRYKGTRVAALKTS